MDQLLFDAHGQERTIQNCFENLQKPSSLNNVTHFNLHGLDEHPVSGIFDPEDSPNLTIAETHKLVNHLRPQQFPEDPFHPDCMQKIQLSVTIGEQLSPEQKSEVMALLAEYTDIFSLSLSEVKRLDFIEHQIDVPDDMKLPRIDTSCPLTDSQRQWLHEHVEKLVEAGIIIRIPYNDVRCVGPIVLALKPRHEVTRSVEELRILANAACVDTGVNLPHPESPFDRSLVAPPAEPAPVQWRLCNNFAALNKASVPNRRSSKMSEQNGRLCNVQCARLSYGISHLHDPSEGLGSDRISSQGPGVLRVYQNAVWTLWGSHHVPRDDGQGVS
jgi:hypothetical protein